MVRVIFAMLLFLCCRNVAAQPRIRTEDTAGGRSTVFYLEDKDRPGTLTVFLTFTDLYNCREAPGTRKYEVRYDNTRLVELHASDESYGVGYKYTYNYVYGPIDRDADTSFVYRMPCSTSKPVRVIRTVYLLDKYLKAEEDRKQLGYAFPLEKGDTVYAMRRGIVTKVDLHEQPGSEVTFTTESTNLTVEHPDGSFAWYTCLDKEGLFVREGDEVLPSQPLALVGNHDGEHYKVFVQTFWRVTNPDPEKRKEQFALTKYFFPRFATTDGDVVLEHARFYTPVATEEMVTREMTKKELKKYRSGRL